MANHIDVDKFVMCVQCKQVPKDPPLYSCREGHLFCEFCFLEKEFCKNKTNDSCKICGNRVRSRNLFGEEILRAISPSKLPPPVEPKPRSNMPAPYIRAEALVTKPKKSKQKNKKVKHTLPEKSESTTSTIRSLTSASFVDASRKPIMCPNTTCNKVIAITHLISHFQFDHIRIPQQCLEFNQAKSMLLSLNSMEYGRSHCVALLVIKQEEGNFSLGISETMSDTGIAFPLLAAKLRCTPEVKPSEEDSSCDNMSELLLLWVCGNVDYNIKCLLEVSDERQTRIYSYYGSVNSLRDDNNPAEVFERADCLILHTTNVKKITQNEKFPMDLRVLISCPYEQAL